MAIPPDFRRLKTRKAICRSLGISEALFERVLAFDPNREMKPLETRGGIFLVSSFEMPPFLRHDIPKRNPDRGVRTVWEPATELKSVYKALARRMDAFFRGHLNGYPHDCAYGFRVGRNIRENAAAHAGHKHLLVTDLEDFFPTISAERIQRLFSELGLAIDVTPVSHPAIMRVLG